MAKLPAGVRRIYNHFYKQKATGEKGYTPTPLEIKEYLDSKGFGQETLDEHQFNETIAYFSKGKLSLPTDKPVVESITGSIKPEIDSSSDDIPAEASLALSDQQIQGIVNNKAASMSMQLSADDVDYVANQIDSVDATLEDVLAQTETLLCAYADHKQRESLEKVDRMFGRVYNHIQNGNQATSDELSRGLKQFGKDVAQSQEAFKSSLLVNLKRLQTSSKPA
ncbi:hypothetical protein [Nostoc sp. DedQUE07]|uniref:hypothetical protein n=1 Tax=Nostoc sp. DedQUE07 TaxID=3075392 RepID=UPI002AD55412|nr:hypothetical protein [Nostoc sp. DedQUE07]MDZ8131927.1 hypothetical protein [Nostoc sp. DedQUE07]